MINIPSVARISGSSEAVAGALSTVVAQINGGGATNPPGGALLVGGPLVVAAVSVGAVFDLSTANALITMTAGTFDRQEVSVGFVGTENGYTGVFSVPSGGPANLLATGYSGAQSTIALGQVGSTVKFTWIAKANGGAGQWLKS